MNLKKVNDHIDQYKNALKTREQDYFNLAICEIGLENYEKARYWFDEATAIILGPRPFWRRSGQPNWLVDITVISGRRDLYPSVLEELALFRLSHTRSHPVGNSPMAHYCYSVMEILCPGSGNIDGWIKDLLKRPKYKDLFAAGLALQAILDQDQNVFTSSLQMLLKAHEGMAKHGMLRLTPEGWLCLPAMTLSILARQNNLRVEIENDYLSLGYLDYLLVNG